MAWIPFLQDLLGIFSGGVTPHSGLIGIVTGFVDINWLYCNFLLFVFTCVLIFAVSAVTKRAPPEQLAGLTYGSVSKEQDAATRASFGFWEVFHTGVILAIIAGIYIYFW